MMLKKYGVGIFSGKPRKVLGIDLDARRIVAVELVQRGLKYVLTRHIIREFAQDNVESNLTDFLNNNDFKGYSCAVAVNAEESFFKGFSTRTSIFKDKEKDKDKINAFISRQSLPINLNDCYWDYLLIGAGLNIVAAKKDLVDKKFSAFNNLPLDSLYVSSAPIALYNIFTLNYPDKKEFCILHVRASCSNLFISESGRLWIHVISIGRNKILESPDKTRELADEVKRFLSSHYLQTESQVKHFSEIFLSDDMSSGNLEILQSSLGMAINYINPLHKIEAKVTLDNTSLLSLSLGLAVSAFSPASLRLNLLKDKQKALDYRKRTRKTKNIIAGVLSLVCLILAALNFQSGAVLNDKKIRFKAYKETADQLIPKYNALLAQQKEIDLRLQSFQPQLLLHEVWVKLLKDISSSKQQGMQITAIDAQTVDSSLSVNLGGSGLNFADINKFLGLMKDKDYISQVVVVSSSPSAEGGAMVDFKARLDIRLTKEAKVSAVDNASAVKPSADKKNQKKKVRRTSKKK